MAVVFVHSCQNDVFVTRSLLFAAQMRAENECAQAKHDFWHSVDVLMNRERDDGYDGKYAWADMKDVMGANKKKFISIWWKWILFIYVLVCMRDQMDKYVFIASARATHKLKFGLEKKCPTSGPMERKQQFLHDFGILNTDTRTFSLLVQHYDRLVNSFGQ